MQNGRRVILALLTLALDRAANASPRARRVLAVVGAAVVFLAGAIAIPGEACAATTPNLYDGRAHIIVGKPKAQPGAKLRRIYPANANAPRGIILIGTRASLPRYFETHELATVRDWAARRGWRTQRTAHVDVTPFVTGKEYRVDRRILSAINQTAARGLSTCTIISGWRDSAKQLVLWRAFLAGTGNPANRPGTSRHEAGYRLPAGAADVYCGGNIAFWTWARARGVDGFARSRGLTMPYGHERWHVEHRAGAR